MTSFSGCGNVVYREHVLAELLKRAVGNMTGSAPAATAISLLPAERQPTLANEGV